MRVVNLMVMLVLAGCFCGCGSRSAVTSEREVEGSPRRDRPAVGEKKVMAYVNGKAIYMERLVELLVRGPGMAYAPQLVRAELIRQELKKQKMVVSDAEVEAEAESILKVMVPQATTAAERKQVLGRLLAQKQVSIEQWTSSIRMAAELRKLAEPKVKITDELLREEFRRIYGHLVVVRQIEVRSLDKAQEVLEKLQEGEKFADMAWKYSINKNARKHGLLAPIGRGTKGVHRAIVQAALSLRTKGEVCDPVQADETFHILKLEKIIPPKNVKFEKVKKKVESALRRRLIGYHQKQIMDKLIRAGRVEYVNPILKRMVVEGKKP